LLIWFGLMGTIFTVPLLRTLQSTKTALGAFILIALAWLFVAGYTSINAVVKAELFPTAVRATGVGLPYAITTSIFGGPTESIALFFKAEGHEAWFFYYLSSLLAVAFIVALIMRDTKKYSTIGGSAELN
jgi:MHS family alpha-ketoglutarate permease-like MFS transporter